MGGFRVLYLLLTNEPSNYKEWVREARREGVNRRGEKGQGRGNVRIRKEWWKERQGKNGIIERVMGKELSKRKGKRQIFDKTDLAH